MFSIVLLIYMSSLVTLCVQGKIATFIKQRRISI